jgi:hypothetical protein
MTGSRPTRTTTNARQRTEPDDQCPSAVSKSSTVGRSDSALCTKCLVVALAGCSLSVTANVRTKGRRPLVLACDIVTKLSASHRGVRTSEGVDLWPLRAMSLAVEASAADVPDNRPLSSRFTGRSFVPRNKRQLAHGPRERWLVDGDVAPAAVMMTSL